MVGPPTRTGGPQVSRRADSAALAHRLTHAFAGSAAGTGGSGRRGHTPSRANTCQAQRVQRVSAKESHRAQASMAILYHHSEIERTLGVGRLADDWSMNQVSPSAPSQGAMRMSGW